MAEINNLEGLVMLASRKYIPNAYKVVALLASKDALEN